MIHFKRRNAPTNSNAIIYVLDKLIGFTSLCELIIIARSSCFVTLGIGDD